MVRETGRRTTFSHWTKRMKKVFPHECIWLWGTKESYTKLDTSVICNCFIILVYFLNGHRRAIEWRMIVTISTGTHENKHTFIAVGQSFCFVLSSGVALMCGYVFNSNDSNDECTHESICHSQWIPKLDSGYVRIADVAAKRTHSNCTN